MVTLSVPLCFYNLPADSSIEAPESISLTIAGKRSEIRALEQEHLAVHIDASELQPGKQLVAITDKKLLLPSSIKLVQHTPSNLTVKLSVPKTS